VILAAAASPEDQVAGVVEYLGRYNISCRSRYGPPHSFGMLWLDIEAPQLWSRSQADNRNFIQGMMDEAARQHVALGIYTSESQWVPIVGDWTGGAKYPLWCVCHRADALCGNACVAGMGADCLVAWRGRYAHYDNNPSFSDFTSFGGWSHPSIKQYTGTSDICGASIDNDWYP